MSVTDVETALPVLDLRRLDAVGARRARFLDELRATARQFGFFYVRGHGIGAGLQQQVLRSPAALLRAAGGGEGGDRDGQLAALPRLHSGGLRAHPRPARLARAARRRRRTAGGGSRSGPAGVGPPAGPQPVASSAARAAATAALFQSETTRLAIRLLRAFAAALSQNEDAFDDLIGDAPGQLIKIIRYPGRDDTGRSGRRPAQGQRPRHRAAAGPLGGLEVEAEDGWIGVPPLPDTYVVNIGELLELASNGYLRATVHRVVTPPAAATGSRWRSSSAPGSMPPWRFSICRTSWRAKPGRHSRPAQPAVPRGRPELPEGPAALASRRRPPASCRPADIGRARRNQARRRLRLLSGRRNRQQVTQPGQR